MKCLGLCNPRCVRITKTDKKDNQVFLSFDCEFSMIEDGFTGEIVPSSGIDNRGIDKRWFKSDILR